MITVMFKTIILFQGIVFDEQIFELPHNLHHQQNTFYSLLHHDKTDKFPRWALLQKNL